MAKTGIKRALAMVVGLALCAFMPLSGAAEAVFFNAKLGEFGTAVLKQVVIDELETTQFVLKKPGGVCLLIDTFDGLIPAALKVADLDQNGTPELIVLLRHPDGIDVMLKVYSAKENFKRIFPDENEDLICREIFVTAYNEMPAICAKHLVGCHSFGPPELYRLEIYTLKNNKLSLAQSSFSEGTHFNILMNKAAWAFNHGNYKEALRLYSDVIASSTGDITSEAFIENLFYLAETKKYLNDFEGALELYKKIVLEFSENAYTNEAQDSIELIAENLCRPKELSYYLKLSALINCERYKEASKLLEEDCVSCDSPIQDRLMFLKAEIYTAENRLEEAIKTYESIKRQFPESTLALKAAQLLEELRAPSEEESEL